MDVLNVNEAPIERAAADYAADLGEPVALVRAALSEVLRRDVSPARHPVVSGELARQIAATRAARGAVGGHKRSA